MATETALTRTDLAPEAQLVLERLEPLKEALGIERLTLPEMQLFAMVAAHTGLDPFTRQIYAIKRGGKVTHQTGIDGYRSSAERTKEYRGSGPASFELCECGDEGSPREHPRVARVDVFRAYPEGIRSQVGEARWHELKPEHRKPQNAYDFLDAMWWQMPFNQLAKCAEANGLRKAFPRVLGDLYIAEEMEQARVIDADPTAPRPTLAERAADKAAAVRAVERSEEGPDGDENTRLRRHGVVREPMVIDLPLAEPMTEEVSAKYVNAEELAGGARAVLRDDVPPWTRERLHDAVAKANVPGTLVTSTFNEVAGSRTRQELTEADWREIATRLDLGA